MVKLKAVYVQVVMIINAVFQDQRLIKIVVKVLILEALVRIQTIVMVKLKTVYVQVVMIINSVFQDQRLIKIVVNVLILEALV